MILARRSNRSAAVGFVLALVAIDSLAIGLIVPIVPELVRVLSGRDPGSASNATGALVATFALAQLLASPILGGLSDRYGRRPVLLISIAGLAANSLLLAWAPSLGWLFLGRALAGGTAANMSTANAYIADVSSPAERARRFGLIGAVASFGFVAGPALGGALGAVDLRLPFVVAAALSMLNWLYGVFVLPESLPRELRRPFSWKGANPVAALRMLLGQDTSRRLAIGWSCFWFALGTLQTVFVLYTVQRFGWGTGSNGAAFTLFGALGALVQGVLVRRVIGWLGERRTAVSGYACSVIGYLVFATASQGWLVYVAIAISAFGGVANPAVRAMLSGLAGPERQGRMMGALSVVEGLTAIISPLVASVLFSVFSDPAAAVVFPGAPFLAVALLYLVGVWAVAGIR